MKSCKDRPEITLKLNVSLASLRIVFIHPDNHSYPIFSLNMKKMDLQYLKCYDHEKVGMTVGNLQIFDCMNYPHTLNPETVYQPDEPIQEKEILGVKGDNQDTKEQMLELEVYIFTYPNEDGCCQH